MLQDGQTLQPEKQATEQPQLWKRRCSVVHSISSLCNSWQWVQCLALQSCFWPSSGWKGDKHVLRSVQPVICIFLRQRNFCVSELLGVTTLKRVCDWHSWCPCHCIHHKRYQTDHWRWHDCSDDRAYFFISEIIWCTSQGFNIFRWQWICIFCIKHTELLGNIFFLWNPIQVRLK